MRAGQMPCLPGERIPLGSSGVLDALVRAHLDVVVEVQLLGDEIHVVEVGAVGDLVAPAELDHHVLVGGVDGAGLLLVLGVEEHARDVQDVARGDEQAADVGLTVALVQIAHEVEGPDHVRTGQRADHREVEVPGVLAVGRLEEVEELHVGQPGLDGVVVVGDPLAVTPELAAVELDARDRGQGALEDRLVEVDALAATVECEAQPPRRGRRGRWRARRRCRCSARGP